MPTFEWHEPDWQATITDLRVECADGSTLWIEPQFGAAVPNPCEVSVGDTIYVGYRFWDDRKHGWGAAQTAEHVCAGNVILDVLDAEVFSDDGSGSGSSGSSAASPSGGTLIVLSTPSDAEVDIHG